MHASEIRELLKLVDQPDIVSFAGGLPDPSLFPISEIGAAYAEILGSPSLAAAALQYSVSEGHLPCADGLSITWQRLACRATSTTSS